MRRYIHLALMSGMFWAAQTVAIAQEQEEDETQDLLEVQVIASPREEGAMRRQPASSTLIDDRQLQNMQAGSLKGIGSYAPNFYMPDYGSRMTSAVYIRGIGSRINSPAVGLYVDDVPVLDKSAFDMGLYDMQRVDILRGPQSTIYGAGTMGGVMKVYSRSPFTHQGTEIGAGYATRDNTRRFTLMHYAKPTKNFAWSFGGYYVGGDGYFRNEVLGMKVDDTQNGAIRFRAVTETARRWMLDMAVNYEVDNEGAYPYYYMGRKDGKPEDKGEQLYRINNNLRGLYDRAVLRTSVNASRVFPRFEFRSITAFQHLTDSMQMDQDLLTDNTYKLHQIQKNLALSEDILLKSRKPGHWHWITGVNASVTRSKIKGPVTFLQDGIAMLNGIINQQANKNMPPVDMPMGPMGTATMRFDFDDKIQGNEVAFRNRFTNDMLTLAAFHQSQLRDLFGVKGLSAMLGLRLNAEMQGLRYAAWYDFEHQYQLGGHLTMPGKEMDIAMMPATSFNVSNGLYSSDYESTVQGTRATKPIHDHHVELLPRVAVQYEYQNVANVYATVSRGYRSGGYNVQNISEVMRGMMMRDMMTNVRDVTLPVLNAQPQIKQETKDQVTNIMNGMTSTPDPDVAQAVTYAPEYAWNYEVGGHLNLLDERLYVDVSAFLTDIHDLQLSQMSETGLGRIMVNAGKSRSAGVELTTKAQPIQALMLTANYGYTHATFRNYEDYDALTNTMVDCKGKYVPFMPQHTVNVDVAYTFPINQHRPAYAFNRNEFIPKALTIGANYSGAGRIYWTEQNNASQDYYSMLGARIALDMHPLSLSLWGRNLTNSSHNTFWFVSGNRAFEQHIRPIQFGLDAKLSF